MIGFFLARHIIHCFLGLTVTGSEFEGLRGKPLTKFSLSGLILAMREASSIACSRQVFFMSFSHYFDLVPAVCAAVSPLMYT